VFFIDLNSLQKDCVMRKFPLLGIVCLSTAVLSMPACDKKEPPKSNIGAGKSTSADKDHDAGHGGPVIDLGTATIGGFSAKVTRDQGDIVAGKDAPIDVTVTPAGGTTAKVVAVRFWIGTEDGAGSAKAKAEIENPAEPNRWHTHAEVPDPLPAGSKLWVEVEDDTGAKNVVSFDLKS
jgi:hypothetical protein